MVVRGRWLRSFFECYVWLIIAAISGTGRAEIERFPARDGQAIELWRVTNDPLVRDHANYHNTQCWSPDGRFLCYVHYGADARQFGAKTVSEVHLFDWHTRQDILVDRGDSPRWANKDNWLFYARFRPQDGPETGKGTQVVWLDVSTGRKTRIAYGVSYLKQTDCQDRWLYAERTADSGRRQAVRIAIRADSVPELLPGTWGVGYNSLYVNPAHPVIVSRDHNYRDYYYAPAGTREIPFVARHFFDHDLAGRKATAPFPIMDGSHFCWSGDGSYFLAGNGPVRGRRWNEPLPANIHFLANTSVGDICPCGFSGRWLCGSTGGGRGPLRVADTRSGDGWIATKTYSFLCFPGSQDNSGPYDIDAKGSPDGTKIAFVSTYDLKDGPATEVVEDFHGDRIAVRSTERFPDRGRLVNPAGFGGEVLSYRRKTPTSFEGITRGLYGTNAEAGIGKGQTLMSFETLLIPPDDRPQRILPPKGIRSIVRDMNSALMWQRSSDLYVAVVRLPDRPFLRRTVDAVELIPGEDHWEVAGYHIYCDDERITDKPLAAGRSFPLPRSGVYRAVAIEWSQLASERSRPLELEGPVTLHVLAEKPVDFSWTLSRYMVEGREASETEAMDAPEAVREIVHRTDGVIAREWLERGQIVRRHDRNQDGQATRRLFYQDGRLVRREYYDRTGKRVSTERFDADGFMTESIHGRNHWWYQHGVPQRFQKGSAVFVRDHDRWPRNR